MSANFVSQNFAARVAGLNVGTIAGKVAVVVGTGGPTTATFLLPALPTLAGGVLEETPGGGRWQLANSAIDVGGGQIVATGVKLN